MSSAAEIRDILNIPQKHASTSSKPAPLKKGAQQLRKEAGISRELYRLIGDSAPTLVAQFTKPKYKQKPNFGATKVTWEWKEFGNQARGDGLRLSHWVKTQPTSPPEEYSFVKFNKTDPSLIYDYSMDEYTRLLEDPDWSKEETDYLFQMVKEYDARFFVIDDRYQFPGGPPRNIQVRPPVAAALRSLKSGPGPQSKILWHLPAPAQKPSICRGRRHKEYTLIQLLL